MSGAAPVTIRTLASYASVCGPVAAARIAAGVSSREMAATLGIAVSTLYGHECGKRPCSDSRVATWAAKVGVSAAKARRMFDAVHRNKQ